MFAPRQVATHATDQEVSLAERSLDLDPLVQAALSAARLIELSFPPLSHPLPNGERAWVRGSRKG